ncbi:MAG TPA: secondary thiamine-phosphate synthase enzyme YjbQ [Candidatus Nanoarchaeia archaeon]|nr:secondary thiamine-phosphate synthase enzyme YjbQ [Candidatus Nanoarchaeia archaeon]
MMQELLVKTTKHQEIVIISDKIKDIIKSSKLNQGICNIYSTNTTATLIVNEVSEPNLREDIMNIFNKIVPMHDNYNHDKLDNNANAHLKSTLVGCNLNIPFKDSKLLLGKWQDIALIELDGPRERKLIVSLIKI